MSFQGFQYERRQGNNKKEKKNHCLYFEFFCQKMSHQLIHERKAG